LHTTSLTEKVDNPEKQIEGLTLRDISFYKTKRLKKIILKETPSAVVLLNLSFILDRVIIRICQDLGISVFYLAHGRLISIDNMGDVKATLNKGSLFSKIKKKNIFSFYNYILGLKSLNEIASFFKNIIKNPTEFITLPKYCKELDATKSFVYYDSDYDLMTKQFGFPKNKVQVVGNPELDGFFNTKIKDKEIFCSQELTIKSNKYVAYMDDGMSKINGWDNERWFEFIVEINEILKKNSLELVVKLHPRREVKEIKSFFIENNITYFQDLDFKNYLHHSLFVICHYSSTIVYALILNKKVKSPRWGVSKGLIKQYPEDAVEYYADKKTFETTISNVDVDEVLIQNYVLDSIGEVDGKSIDRVVDEILKNV
ncbi:hypothetical protein OAC97_03050, partial [Flavobacteriaceae bacterium]|nr:hypothetical protein [Flavobacteriaceae bacterium]